MNRIALILTLAMLALVSVGCRSQLKAKTSWAQMESLVNSNFSVGMSHAQVENRLVDMDYDIDPWSNSSFVHYDMDEEQSSRSPGHQSGDLRAGLSGRGVLKGFPFTESRFVHIVRSQSLIFRFGGDDSLDDIIYVIHHIESAGDRYDHPGDPANDWYVIDLSESEATP